MYLKPIITVSLLIVVLSLISENKSLSVNHSGWILIEREKYPPKLDNESYLYMEGPGKILEVIFEYKLLDIQEVTNIEISLNYWAFWNATKFPPSDLSTELFQLAVIPCKGSHPRTKYMEFDDFNPNEWSYQSYTTSNSSSTFNTLCREKVIIQALDNTQNVNKITSKDKYMVVLNNIKIEYQYKTKVGGKFSHPIIESKVCSNQYCPDFVIKNGHWIHPHLPSSNLNFNYFYNTLNDKCLTFSFNTIYCIQFYYWITNNAQIWIQIGSSKTKLTLTSTLDFNAPLIKYKWYQAKLCPAHFIYPQSLNKLDIKLVPSSFSKENHELIAVSYADDNNLSPFDPNIEPVLFLYHWNRSQSRSQWYTLSENIIIEITDSLQFTLKVQPKSFGVAYIYSTWIKYVYDWLFNYQIQLQTPGLNVTCDLLLLDLNFNVIYSTQLKLTNSSHSIYCDNCTLVTMMIRFTFNSSNRSYPDTLMINNVDLSDGCRDSNICSNKGECINVGPNKYKCNCSLSTYGQSCEKTNYCLVNYNGQINGDAYCRSKNAVCLKETFSPDNRTCHCNSDLYHWKQINQNRGKCVETYKCLGMNTFCARGYLCDEDSLNQSGNCLICDTSNNYYKNKLGKCVKKNICKKCGQAKCKTIFHQSYCYCKPGESLSQNMTQCITIKQCSVWDKQIHKCEQDCVYKNKQVHCICFPGYTLNEDNRTCTSLFEDQQECPSNAIRVQVSSNETTCQCKKGYLQNGQECTDICLLAKNNNKTALDEVKEQCHSENCNVQNGHFTCKCLFPLMVNKNGHCQLKKHCLPSNQGYQECAQKNALCLPDNQNQTHFYQCICPLGTQSKHGKCINQCEQYLECFLTNGVCRSTYNLLTANNESSNVQPICECRPGSVRISDYCLTSQSSFRYQFTLRLLKPLNYSYYDVEHQLNDYCSKIDKRYWTECLDYINRIQSIIWNKEGDKIIENALRQAIYQNILATNQHQPPDSFHFISYQKVNPKTKKTWNTDYNVTISIEYHYLFNHLINNFDCINAFTPDDLRSNYCIIPPELLIKNGSLIKAPLSPCKDGDDIEYCPLFSQCISISQHYYMCKCKDGFKPEVVTSLSLEDSSLIKEFCIDIDECKSDIKCANNSHCSNTIGSYECICDHNYTRNELGLCTDPCEHLGCIHGDCYMLDTIVAVCRCNFFYKGLRCDRFQEGFILSLILVIFLCISLLVFMAHRRRVKPKREHLGPSFTYDNTKYDQSQF